MDHQVNEPDWRRGCSCTAVNSVYSAGRCKPDQRFSCLSWAKTFAVSLCTQVFNTLDWDVIQYVSALSAVEMFQR